MKAEFARCYKKGRGLKTNKGVSTYGTISSNCGG